MFYGDTYRLVREGRVCMHTKTNTRERFQNSTCIHPSSLPVTPFCMCHSLNSPPCPRQGCGYILGSLHRGVREGGCMCACIQTGQVKCSSTKISLLSHSFSLFFSHFFPSFSIPPDPVSFVPHGTGSTSRTRPGSFRWNEPCGN